MLMSVRTLGIRIDATDILGGIWMTQLALFVLLTRSCHLIGCEGQLSKPSPRLTSEISVENPDLCISHVFESIIKAVTR
jgi:hypothetical protein